MEFMNALKNESVSAENNVSFTENGMRGFRTSGNALLDMNFAVSSLRRRAARDVEAMFVNALAENFDLAVVWLFFARDVRGGGMGERRLFRICFSHLMKKLQLSIDCHYQPRCSFFNIIRSSIRTTYPTSMEVTQI